MTGERLAKWPSGHGVKAFPADAISSLISLSPPVRKDGDLLGHLARVAAIAGIAGENGYGRSEVNRWRLYWWRKYF